MNRSHPLRVVRALALAVVVPGCTGTSAPDPAPTEAPHLAQADAQSVADAATPDPDADDVDAGLPFSSGPIVPPELPEGLA